MFSRWNGSRVDQDIWSISLHNNVHPYKSIYRVRANDEVPWHMTRMLVLCLWWTGISKGSLHWKQEYTAWQQKRKDTLLQSTDVTEVGNCGHLLQVLKSSWPKHPHDHKQEPNHKLSFPAVISSKLFKGYLTTNIVFHSCKYSSSYPEHLIQSRRAWMM